jgi:hypothetical protein
MEWFRCRPWIQAPVLQKKKKKKDFVLPLIKCKSGHNYFTNNHLNIPCSKGLI